MTNLYDMYAEMPKEIWEPRRPGDEENLAAREAAKFYPKRLGKLIDSDVIRSLVDPSIIEDGLSDGVVEEIAMAVEFTRRTLYSATFLSDEIADNPIGDGEGGPSLGEVRTLTLIGTNVAHALQFLALADQYLETEIGYLVKDTRFVTAVDQVPPKELLIEMRTALRAMMPADRNKVLLEAVEAKDTRTYDAVTQGQAWLSGLSADERSQFSVAFTRRYFEAQ